ncbi:MAG: outer membrane protein transport protein [Gammaproteobacteria bacterium]|nr:outer membrane protein transport protein [Gammaproteobacteria bacterium]
MIRIPGRLTALCAAILPLLPLSAHATNGMNMEGYGPIAAAMGGASMAYDNGSAAMMNNPATIGMMDDGDRLDAFFGFLGPDVESEAGGMTAESDGNAYYMPAAGFLHKREGLTYGIGMYGQGGMGTEYGSSSFMSMGAGLENRTELSVGRVIAPLSFNVNDKLVVGGSLDFVWAGLDLRMAMSEAQFADMANPAAQTIGTASGSLVNAFGAMYEPFGGAGISRLDFAYFDYSNGSRFSGKARGYGAAGKLGAAYKVNDRLTVGASYHSETRLGDMETDDAVVRMSVNANFGAGYQDYDIPVTGKIAVKDFQWPSTYGIGAAFQATDKLMLAADVKRINWADTMQDFRMVFTADATQANPYAGGFAGLDLDAALFQRWDDQTVYQLGGAYRVDKQLTLRAGYNHGDNPVPNTYLNALFPAIVEDHVTAGFGYGFNEKQSVDFSVQHALEVSNTNPGNGSTIPAVTSRHAQTSFQFIYSHRF